MTEHLRCLHCTFEETEQSKIFPNKAFGYWKVTVERPLRLTVDLSSERRRSGSARSAERRRRSRWRMSLTA